MTKFFTFLFISVFSAHLCFATNEIPKRQAIEGRWDLTVDLGDRLAASWLEVRLSGIKTLVGYFVADGGGARPISEVFFKDNKVSFHIPGQWEDTDKELMVEGTLKDGKLSGTMLTPRGQRITWVGVPAPSLKRDKAPVWGKPIPLFNGKNLDGWQATGKENQWVVENGILKSPRPGSNIKTNKTFNDFKLHIEFRYPKESNSGVYLRGRYEVQVEDSKGMEATNIHLGGLYGFIDPLEMVAKNAGEWQSFDITLVGRIVTVIANGKTIIRDQIIPGITGGALDSREAEPGPIMMQGDHGLIEYRNIVITPAK
ncbi:MAG: DUF1080 domain-containing protein [Bacteroidetes bacterium]|nr:DUF1080 domain-containing protein [Bacteroidota bacterium]